MQRRTVAPVLCLAVAALAVLGATSGTVSRSEYEALRQKVLVLETKLKTTGRGRIMDTVTASTFHLVDKQGKTRGGMSVGDDGTAVIFARGSRLGRCLIMRVSRKGEASIALYGQGKGNTTTIYPSSIAMMDGSKNRAVLLLAGDEGGCVRVESKRNGAAASLVAAKGSAGARVESKTRTRDLEMAIGADGRAHVPR